MKKALIDPNRNVFIQNKTSLLIEESNHKIVAEISDSEFDVASPLFWVDCADDLDAVASHYNTTTETIETTEKGCEWDIYVGETDNTTIRSNLKFNAGETIRVSLIDNNNLVSNDCSVNYTIENAHRYSGNTQQAVETGSANFSSGRIDLTLNVSADLTNASNKSIYVLFEKDGCDSLPEKKEIIINAAS